MGSSDLYHRANPSGLPHSTGKTKLVGHATATEPITLEQYRAQLAAEKARQQDEGGDE